MIGFGMAVASCWTIMQTTEPRPRQITTPTPHHSIFSSFTGWMQSRLVLPFWYRLTRVVPDKGPLNGCVCVCVLQAGCSSWRPINRVKAPKAQIPTKWKLHEQFSVKLFLKCSCWSPTYPAWGLSSSFPSYRLSFCCPFSRLFPFCLSCPCLGRSPGKQRSAWS